jgi:myo-inositol-1(or 4)-monophosphatase
MSDDHDARADLARRAARAGASVAMEYFRTDVAVERKDGKTDVVTEADRKAQRQVIETIRDEFAADAIVGEEEEELKTVPNEGAAWVIDPIDGTNNFVRGIRVWATSVAAVVDGEPVAAATVLPAMDDAYYRSPEGAFRNGERISVSEKSDPDLFAVCPTIWWPPERRDEYSAVTEAILYRFGDMRRYGCAQAVLAMVAEGSLEGTVTNVDANPWDTVAGVSMVREAGGVVTDLDGDRWRHDSRGLVASNGEAHDELLETARAATDVRS